MTELLLDDIEHSLFKIGLDFSRGVGSGDEYDEYNYIRIIDGTQHLDIYPLWSEPSSGDDDTYFLDSDDISARLYMDGEVDCEVDLFPASSEGLVDMVETIFTSGVDFLREMS